MSIRLSPRLRTVAGFVPAGARVIDVGTDHARVPVWLVQEGIAAHVWASDIREGPLRGAEALIRETDTEDRISLRLTDGLAGFGPEDGDTVILAGMGGETMISILAPAHWLREGCLLILEPQSKQHLLRSWLAENGFAVEREVLAADGGRIYPILTARPGTAEACSEAELYTGRFKLIGEDPLFPRYLKTLMRSAAAAAPHDPAAARRLEGLRQMEERLT